MLTNGWAMHSADFQCTSLSNVNKYKIEKLNLINPINPALCIAVVTKRAFSFRWFEFTLLSDRNIVRSLFIFCAFLLSKIVRDLYFPSTLKPFCLSIFLRF